jgi:DnaJ-class molecular chaperone
MSDNEKDICSVCGGTGQVSFFQGVSRFLLTTEECPECAGTGYKLDMEEPHTAKSNSKKRKKKK